ncbi:MAG TPA: hypothetical protein PKD34_00035 [Candidatus Doudnabacteria bacterium]|nr:hypothetical protein [Candidatus Doudnabacteria bacterium]
METITLVDLFFIITGIAIIFVTAFLVIALIYFIMFMRALKMVADQATRGVKLVTEDLSEFSKNIKSEGFKIGSFIKFVLGMKPKQTRKKK